MLTIIVPSAELYDEKNNEFVQIKEQTIVLEHSLVSIAKWESKWKKSYLSSQNKTYEETIDYIKCMTITKNVKPIIYKTLNKDAMQAIQNYINDSMTATYFSEVDSKGNRSIITAEVIYYWMISLGIPFECQKWHFNRLMALIKVCDIKTNPGKRMSKREILTRNQALNEERKRKYNTRG